MENPQRYSGNRKSADTLAGFENSNEIKKLDGYPA